MSSIRTANAHRALEYDSENTPIGLAAAQRYAVLLSGGFLLTQDTTHTGDRDKYDDTDGRFGLAGTSYYFDGTDNTWYDADPDGNALISF